MVFSSITFLMFFLPMVFIIYYCLPSIKMKNGLLVIASLIFYALGEPYYIILLLLSSLINYNIAIGMEKKNDKKLILLIIALIMNLGALFIFKYLSFFISIINSMGLRLPQCQIRLPIGISFYTFQILSYVIDVYKGKENAQYHFGNVLLYISFFPQLIAGPIVKYHDISQQIDNREHTIDNISLGMRRFIFGLSKKVLLSNVLAQIVDQIYDWNVSELNFYVTWIAAILYCLQIYYDFSGYSDMAIGLGRMFGFHFNENFNYPYASTSVKEFWRRWHISLSSWFKEYLYIPLGGNRISNQRTIINKFIVFFCTGLWHGANYTFVLWGLMNGFFSSLEEKGQWIKKIEGTWIGWIYTTFITIICFVMFRSESLSQAIYFYKCMFLGFSTYSSQLSSLLIYFDRYTLIIVFISLLAMFNWKKVLLKYNQLECISYVLSIICLLLCIMSLAVNSYNPFIYFRF